MSEIGSQRYLAKVAIKLRSADKDAGSIYHNGIILVEVDGGFWCWRTVPVQRDRSFKHVFDAVVFDEGYTGLYFIAFMESDIYG